jgi:tetratricopeptide (TPR) repeat protein
MTSSSPSTRFGALLFAGLVLAGCDLLGGTDRRLAEAGKLIDQGEYTTAVIVARNAARKEPAHAGAQLLLARAQLRANEIEAALQTLGDAEKAGGNPQQIAAMRARLMFEMGHGAELLQSIDSGQLALDETARPYFRARALQASRRYAEALHAFEKLTSSPDGEADLALRRAECQLALGRRDRASEAVDRALAADADFAPALLVRAEILQLSGDAPGALTVARKAAAAPPGKLDLAERSALYASLIQRELARGDVAAAQADHAALVKLSPQSPLVERLRTQIDLARGEVAVALTRLQTQVQKNPQDGSARLALVAAQLVDNQPALAVHEASTLATGAPNEPRFAELHRQVDELTAMPATGPQRAIATTRILLSMDYAGAARYVFERALKAADDAPELEFARIGLEIQTGQSAVALERARTFAAAHPDAQQAAGVLASAQIAAGDTAGAVATYEKLWSAAPSGPLAIAISSARLEMGATDADKVLRDWLAKNPGDVAARAVLAQNEQQAGRLEAAAREYERVLGATPPSPILLNNLADVYGRIGDRRALDTARRAHAAASGSPQIMDTYGWLLVQSGDVDTGLPMLRAAAAALPDAVDIRYHLGAAQARAGERETARILLEDSLADGRPFAGSDAARRLLSELQAAPAP